MADKPRDPKKDGSQPDHVTLNSPGYASTAPISGEERTVAETKNVRLADGETVAGRYRVLRYLARGGMGEVYEAEDLELGERVALKTIRAETRDRIAEERFKREIQLSRKVTHPNVCRIFDVGYHVRHDGDRVVFLTMELLRGETLIDRIRRDGPIDLPEAGVLLRQISAGLTAAHTAGVVHRDLKSSNVILVPRKIGGVRAVVTDFGLAHVLGGGEDRARSLSGSGGIVGTPGYMAPEQVEGGDLSARTDLYALGVVMYEMITAQLPFDGTTPLSIAAKRLTTDAPSPKKLRPDLPARWEKAVLACLERDPANRPPNARAVAEMLGLVTDSLEEVDGTVRVDKMPRRISPLVPAAIVLVLALAGVGVQRWRDRGHASSRRAVAAVPFHPADELTAEQTWIGEFAAELVSLRLAEGQSLQSFDASSVASSLSDVGVSAGAELAPTELDRLSALLTLDLVVTGRYHIVRDGTIIVEARLRDVHSHRTLVEVSEQGKPSELATLLGRVADRIARAAGVTAADSGRSVGVTLPKHPETLRAYVEAREHFDRREVQEAIAIAQQGSREEADYPRLHLLIGEAAELLGDDRLAAEEGKRAAELSRSLPTREQVFVQAAAAALQRDRAGAISRYEKLRAELPDDLDIGTRLVDQLNRGLRANDALKLVEQLRKQQVSRLLGVRLDLLQADSHEALGEFERAAELAERAAQTADEIGARLLRASARFEQCRALAEMHRNGDARVACEAAKRTASDAGSRRLRALAVDWIANVDYDTGNLDAAKRGYEEVLPVFRELGDHTGEAAALNNLGNVSFTDADPAGAVKMWTASLKLTDEFQAPKAGASTRENLSIIHHRDLEWQKATSYAESAAEIWRTADEPDSLAEATCNLADIYFDAGRGRDGERQLEALEALEARLGTPPQLTACDELRASVEVGRGHSERAIVILRASAERIRKTHQEVERILAGYDLAKVQADAGDRNAALTTLDDLPPRAVMKSDAAAMRLARLLRLRLDLLAKVAERGRDRLHAIEEELKGETDKRAKIATQIEIERTRALVGDGAQAQKRLHAVAESAFATGAVSLALEAQLREAELAGELGHPPPRPFVIEYARRARAAGRPGWAERVEQLEEGRR